MKTELPLIQTAGKGGVGTGFKVACRGSLKDFSKIGCRDGNELGDLLKWASFEIR